MREYAKLFRWITKKKLLCYLHLWHRSFPFCSLSKTERKPPPPPPPPPPRKRNAIYKYETLDYIIIPAQSKWKTDKGVANFVKRLPATGTSAIFYSFCSLNIIVWHGIESVCRQPNKTPLLSFFFILFHHKNKNNKKKQTSKILG